MPQILEVTAKFRRQTQPIQYQSAESELVIKAQFSEDEYKGGAAAVLLNECRVMVLGSLGLPIDTNATGTVTAKVVDTPASKANKVEKVKKDTPAPVEAKTPAADAIDMGDGPAKVEEPKATAAGATITDAELSTAASAAAKRTSAADVREALKKIGVARLSEVPQDQRKAFVVTLEGMKKE